jgi:hypothetical protein
LRGKTRLRQQFLALKTAASQHHFFMALTMEEIVRETRNWPAEKVTELVGLLCSDLHESLPEIDQTWKDTAQRRLEELNSGKVREVPGEQVAAKIRKILSR